MNSPESSKTQESTKHVLKHPDGTVRVFVLGSDGINTIYNYDKASNPINLNDIKGVAPTHYVTGSIAALRNVWRRSTGNGFRVVNKNTIIS